MTQIELRGVQKFFGAVQVIKDLNLKIDDNEFIVVNVPALRSHHRREVDVGRDISQARPDGCPAGARADARMTGCHPPETTYDAHPRSFCTTTSTVG